MKMKALLLLAVAAFGLRHIPNEESLTMGWKEWKVKFPKWETGLQHDDSKEAAFHENIAFIKDCNQRYKAEKQGFYCGVNEWTDMSSAEFKAVMLPSRFNSTRVRNEEFIVEKPLDGVDWRTQGAVTDVKNQGHCGSCWSFSATGSMEGAWKLAGNDLTSLSEEELVQCSKSYGNNGCNGGLMDNAFKYVEAVGGISAEAGYPYTSGHGTTGSCHQDEIKHVATVAGLTDVMRSNSQQMAAAVSKGPVSVAIEADQSAFQHYKSGVFDAACGTKLDHGVLVVGYNTQAWIVKNSWGPTWGDQGYIQMVRKGGNGQCGILMQPSYPKAGSMPGPTPPGPTPGPSSGDYENPYTSGGCKAGEKDVSIQGVTGAICVPECVGNTCPAAPNGVTAQAQCALKTPQGQHYCALLCSPTQSNSCDPDKNLTCKPISGVGICTYNMVEEKKTASKLDLELVY